MTPRFRHFLLWETTVRGVSLIWTSRPPDRNRMTPRPDPSSSVLEQASAWAVRLAAEDATEADFLALEVWLEQSPDHVLAYNQAEGLLAALDDDRAALDAVLSRAASTTATTTHSPSQRSSSRRAKPWRWAAGAFTVAAAVVAAVALTPALVGRTEVYVTAPGEQRTIALADGSTIVLNGGSRLSVRLNGRERRVEMASAEAAFDVAHDASRPFLVTVGESQVEVLGTAFEIRRDQAATRVAVTRGDDPARNVRLTKGQTVEREDDDGLLEVSPGSTEPAGWRTGRLVYEDRPLSEIVADLNRAYPMQIRTSGDVGALRFTGVIVLDDQASIIRRLETFLPVAAVQRDGVIELRSR
jgi:transmembrane sensor